MGNPHLPTHNQNINTEEIEERNPFIAKQRNFGGKGEHKGHVQGLFREGGQAYSMSGTNFSAHDAAKKREECNAQSSMHYSVLATYR